MLSFSGGDFLSIFLFLLIAISILAISISFHEASHAWMAERLGDPTAKYLGRVSLNPIDHIDPLGTIILPLGLIILSLTTGTPLFLFGWAKPTPFNPWNLKNPRRDSALISFAGPASNFIIAILFGLVFRLLHPTVDSLAGQVIFGIVYLNIILGVFNLVPIHPLDGFKVVGGLLPKELYYSWISWERYGPLILLALIILGNGLFASILGPITQFILRLLLG